MGYSVGVGSSVKPSSLKLSNTNSVSYTSYLVNSDSVSTYVDNANFNQENYTYQLYDESSNNNKDVYYKSAVKEFFGTLVHNVASSDLPGVGISGKVISGTISMILYFNSSYGNNGNSGINYAVTGIYVTMNIFSSKMVDYLDRLKLSKLSGSLIETRLSLSPAIITFVYTLIRDLPNLIIDPKNNYGSSILDLSIAVCNSFITTICFKGLKIGNIKIPDIPNILNDSEQCLVKALVANEDGTVDQQAATAAAIGKIVGTVAALCLFSSVASSAIVLASIVYLGSIAVECVLGWIVHQIVISDS